MHLIGHFGALLAVFPHPTLHGFSFAAPERLYLLLLLIPALAIWLWQAHGIRRWAAPFLRTLVLALIILALAEPRSTSRSEGAATRPVLLDLSASITPRMRVYALDLIHNRLKLRDGDPAILFASSAIPSTVGAATRDSATNGCAACGPNATNLENALDALLAQSPGPGAVALITDGWENRGNVDAALRAVNAAGIQLYLFTPPGADNIPNVAVTQLDLPSMLQKAEPFALGVTLANLNANPAGGVVSIYRNGTLIDERQVTLAPGQTRLDFPVRTADSGLVSYRAIFKPQNPAQDAEPADDSREGWVGVGAQRKVLIVTDTMRDASYLDSAVRQLGMLPTTLTASASERINPQGYDAVILNNVARAHLSPATQEELVRYVDAGGSLAMTGGDQSFGLGGYADTPIARILPVLMKPPEHRERKRALILVIDKSGSMGRNHKLEYAKAAALTVTKTMKDTDLIGVIGFDSQPFEVVSLQPLGKIRPYFSELIDRLAAHGTTYLLPALQEANRTLQQSGAAIKHVVILTDGETGGTADMYYDLVSSMHHDEGATISAIAIGREANLPLLESIAKYGGGGFYQTDSPQNLPELFVEDLKERAGGDTTMVENSFQPYSVAPDPVLKDLAGRRLAPLKGFVATQLKPAAKLDMFVDSNGQRVPIIASWSSGAGKTLAMTTDASGRWSGAWVRDGNFLPIWDKVLAWLTPPTGPTATNFGVAMGYSSGQIMLNLTDYNENVSPTALPVTASVIAPDGARFDVPLVPEALGEVRGRIEASMPGAYRIELKAPGGAAQPAFPPLAYTVPRSVIDETPRPSPNYALLERIASATGGRLNPSPDELAVSRPLSEQSHSLNPWLILAAMILLISEALVRRLTF